MQLQRQYRDAQQARLWRWWTRMIKNYEVAIVGRGKENGEQREVDQEASRWHNGGAYQSYLNNTETVLNVETQCGKRRVERKLYDYILIK